jgi:hypothetical protein
MGIRFGLVKVSSRGVRVRVGPRIARVHVGTGRPGISTGIGPFTAYQSLGGKKRKPAPYWYGFLSDGSECPHRHRSEAAAQECTRRTRRQAGLRACR